MADDYQRGRSGRPIARIRARLKAEGSHICWLCGSPIDLDLPQTHRMSWTLDHVIPLSIRPDLWGEPSNHREAHRTCNSSRGRGQPNPPVAGSRRW